MIARKAPLGMSVSYDRVMDVRRGLALSVSSRFAEDGAVQTSSGESIFANGGVDNIDESAGTVFHCTAISLTRWPLNFSPWMSPKVPLSSFLVTSPLRCTLMNMLEKSNFCRFQMELVCQLSLQISKQGYLMKRVLTIATYNIVTEKHEKLQEILVTYSGFFSHS